MSRKNAIRKSEGTTYGAVPNPASPGTDGASDKPKTTENLEKLKKDVNEVQGILKENVEKVIKRGEKVEDLSDRTGNLAITSTHFKNTATELKVSTRRRNRKLIACIVCVVVVILTIITLIVLYVLKVI